MVEHMFLNPWKIEIPQADPQGRAGKVPACGFHMLRSRRTADWMGVDGSR